MYKHKNEYIICLKYALAFFWAYVRKSSSIWAADATRLFFIRSIDHSMAMGRGLFP